MPSAITSTDNQLLIQDGHASITLSTESSSGVVESRNTVRRKGVRKTKSGDMLQSSTRQQHRGTERSRSASNGKNLAPDPTRQRGSKLSPRPNLDGSIASTNSPTSDDESIVSYSLDNEQQTQQKKKGHKTSNNVRSQTSGTNREGSDALDSQKSRTTHRMNGSERDAPSPRARGRKKPSSVLPCEDSLTNASTPSFNSSSTSVRVKSKKKSSKLRAEDIADDSSCRSDGRKARSTSRAGGTKQRSSSRKLSGDGEKGNRRSRRSRTPSSKKELMPNYDGSLYIRRGPVSEGEIMELLSSTNDTPLVTRDEETQQRTTRTRKISKSPRPESSKSSYHQMRCSRKHPSNVQRRRSNSSDALDSKVTALRRFSDEDEERSEKKEKRRIPPRRTRSNNIGVDSSRLDSFLQHDVSASRRKKPTGSSGSVLSSSKSVSLSRSRTVCSTRSSKSMRRRKNARSVKSLKSISPLTSTRDHHRDIKSDIDISGHRSCFTDADFIIESDYDGSDSDGERSVDLDLATARDFAQQNLNEKLQLHLDRTDELLYSVFPKHIADSLRNGQKVAPENHDLVTIFFSDIVGFTDISAKLDPLKISDMLDRLYNSFDSLSDYHDVFKVETIGDAYMAVTNLTKEQPDHCKRITEFAIDSIRVANQTLIDEDSPSMGFVNIRVGFHSGSVVSNVVGTRNPRYCLFGDTVNTASRMESNSEKNRIHCSETSAALLRQQCPRMRIFPRGSIDVKGKGEMKTFWIHTEGSYSARDRNKGTILSFIKGVRKR